MSITVLKEVLSLISLSGNHIFAIIKRGKKPNKLIYCFTSNFQS